MEIFNIISYASAAVSFFFVLLFSARKIRKNHINVAFAIAITFSFFWSLYAAYVAYDHDVLMETIFPWETLRNVSWLLFLYELSAERKTSFNLARLAKSPRTYAIVICIVIILILELVPQIRYLIDQQLGKDTRLYIHICFPILALILIEQLYRNASAEQHWAVKFMCLGVGLIYTIDFILYSKSLLFTKVDYSLWQARGIINAFATPFIIVSFNRLQNKRLELTVSRQAVFHTLMLFCTGSYLILMAIAGFYINVYGGSWGDIAQILFVSIALLFLILLFLSGNLRAKARVLINKHFFHYNYDYREEWIKLSNSIAYLKSYRQVADLTINTLCNIVHSSGGELWLQNEHGDFYCSYKLNVNFDLPQKIPANLPDLRFLREKKWILDFNELKHKPGLFHNIDLTLWQPGKNKIRLLIPLFQQDTVIAIAILSNSRFTRHLNWEDFDILETTCMQLSNALMLSHTSEELSRVRQFEAYNRLSAYLVHDLKNQAAQISLIVKNAEKHKRNPEFVDDSIDTLKNVNVKMQHLVEQLKQGRNRLDKQTRLNLTSTITEVLKQQSSQQPIPQKAGSNKNCLIKADKHKLASVLSNLVQNAQDATPDDGRVTIELQEKKHFAVLKISDTGSGMNEEFIRDRLFTPFDTTKGNAGMGIGVYEAREYINKLSGNMFVDSKVGYGTTFTIQIPLEENPD